MAVVVMWDDGTEARWDSGSDWEQSGIRAPYDIHGKDNGLIATIPDFGVRYLATTSPDQITEPERGPNDLVASRIRETD